MKLLIVLVLALVLANTAPAVVARGRMFNSKNVEPEQMPSLVRIECQFGEMISRCSGTLISAEWVLTAAHCLLYKGMKLSSINVFMGSNQRNVHETNVTVYPVTANNVKTHEGYNITGNLENDIALLRIQEVEINENINIANLPYRENTECKDHSALLAGWGWTDGKRSKAIFAQWNYFNVLPSHYCSRFREKFYENQICLSHESASACPGDSGGPMYKCGQLAGIGSYVSSSACNSNSRMVYTNVMYFIDWIRASIYASQ